MHAASVHGGRERLMVRLTRFAVIASLAAAFVAFVFLFWPRPEKRQIDTMKLMALLTSLDSHPDTVLLGRTRGDREAAELADQLLLVLTTVRWNLQRVPRTHQSRNGQPGVIIRFRRANDPQLRALSDGLRAMKIVTTEEYVPDNDVDLEIKVGKNPD